jgi:hypothetical protein
MITNKKATTTKTPGTPVEFPPAAVRVLCAAYYRWSTFAVYRQQFAEDAERGLTDDAGRLWVAALAQSGGGQDGPVSSIVRLQVTGGDSGTQVWRIPVDSLRTFGVWIEGLEAED